MKVNFPKLPPFIVVNDQAQVYCGLKRGYPSFTEDWDEAKPLTNPSCLRLIQWGTHTKLEILYI
jgi:hypothetical protein